MSNSVLDTLFFRLLARFWVPLFVVLAAFLVWETTTLSFQRALNALIRTGENRLTLIDGTLTAALDRYADLPYILSENREIRRMLETGVIPGTVNLYLEALNREAGCEALYILDSGGNTVAASNWRSRSSFFGENYGFRPYFLSAKAGRRGWHFGVGATTGIPGYFMSHPVSRENRFLGAVVVKVDLTPLQEGWKKGGESVLVTDKNRITFLSSKGEWRYRAMKPLAREQEKAIKKARQYGHQSLDRLSFKTDTVLETGKRFVHLGQTRYLMLTRTLQERNWHLHYLMPMGQVLSWRRAVAGIGTFLALALATLTLYVRERRLKKISNRKARAAEAVQAMNQRLQEEIKERSRTEKALRETQEELVQTGKLAALGHMAAGIVHELNQPISAIRTHAASARLLLDRNDTDRVRETFSAISRVTDHMASVTGQLKTFAHRSRAEKKPVSLQECLDGALVLTAPLIEANGVELQKRIPDWPLMVQGDRVRVRQVLVNLIRNAVDAMKKSPEKILEIKFRPGDTRVDISISDTGTGIAQQDLDEIFTPFFTTKEVGEGLGLGLSISHRIIRDLDGTVKVRNLGKGACFTVRLPLIPETATQHEETS